MFEVLAKISKKVWDIPAVRAVSAAAGLVLFIAFLSWLFVTFDWQWWLFSTLVGVLLGLLVGFFVLIRSPKNVQIATVGIFSGMGIDLAATVTGDGGPETALNALASVVAAGVRGTLKAADDTGIPLAAIELPVAVGLWVFILVLALVMLFGLIFEAKEKEA